MSKHEPVTEWPADPMKFDRDVPDDGEGHAWIQWKGTNVCMDVRCRCGARGHVDADFAYFYRCAACGGTFCVGQTVRLYQIEPAAVATVIGSGSCVVTDPDAEHGE